MSTPVRRPRLALPYTVVADGDTVRLIAGEDFRYTLTGPNLGQWLPPLLAQLDGRTPLPQALAGLDAARRQAALRLVERLYGERVLVDGPAESAHRPAAYRLAVEGCGALVERLARLGSDDPLRPPLRVLCQDRLDLAAALAVNRRCRGDASPWLWVSYGPLGRGYVSPIFLPDAGPCLGCLLGHFRRLSPAPELYDALIDYARRGGAIEPVPFPESGVGVLAELAAWKAALLADAEPPAALFRLHVVETGSLEVSSHAVYVDPECPECRGGMG
jgi:bacteriocin biosynthesis cyclodehydratase domain-containing protein